jgi:4-amino-4-deoxy-L-arabinose transferase-like glycosyltransferase
VTPPPPHFTYRDLAFPIVLAAAHAILWVVANHREGVWRQVPAIDQAHDLNSAWIMFRALAERNVPALLDGWVSASPVHTPLVPFASALLMVAFGESRIVAESVLPIFTALWLVATYMTLSRLYGRDTARNATALVSTFPVFLIYSRTYLHEHPLAAMFACACAALLATDRFQNTRASAVFGVLAGMTALARGGGAVFLVGPVLVVLAAACSGPHRGRRIANCGLATLIGLGVAATWYGPNFLSFAEYLLKATYGADTLRRTGATAVTLLDSVFYYVSWLIAQGPGAPLVVVVSVAGISGISRPGSLASGVSMALGVAFTIDFILLLPTVVQQEGARYFQPLMPILAVGLVRSIERARPRALRYLCSLATCLLACHHVVALYGFVREPPEAAAASLGDAPVWDHTTYFAQFSPPGVSHADIDFKLPEIIERLSLLGLPAGARIATLSTPHAFFQPNGLQWEATRQRRDWRFVWSPDTYSANPFDTDTLLAQGLDAILVRREQSIVTERSAPGGTASSGTDLPGAAFHARDHLRLEDGSLVTILVAAR